MPLPQAPEDPPDATPVRTQLLMVVLVQFAGAGGGVGVGLGEGAGDGFGEGGGVGVEPGCVLVFAYAADDCINLISMHW